MSYFSEIEYKVKKNKEELWFERLYFGRWFKDMAGPILDVGCATGNFMAVKPEIMEGVEIDETSCRLARERGFNVLQLDVETQMIRLEDNRYQGIYAKHVIEHLVDPLNFLKELKRILRSGGKAVILTPNCPYMLNHGFFDDYTHRHPFTAKSLRMIAFDAGFTDTKIYEDFRCFPGLGKLMRLFHLSPRLIMTVQSFFGVRGLSLIMELSNK